jgi:hypothetical protein
VCHRQNQGLGVEILTRSDYQVHAADNIPHIRADFLDKLSNLTPQRDLDNELFPAPRRHVGNL